MSLVNRILIRHVKNRCQFFQRMHTCVKDLSNLTATSVAANEPAVYENLKKHEKHKKLYPAEYRFIYPEFLPDPDPTRRNSLREKLERKDMLSRRAVVDIPEFYVGSIVGVTYSDIHAPTKFNRFVGICILRTSCGLRATFLLRNVVDGQPVEIDFDLYDPCIRSISCLRLEKRLDDNLLYLRDAPPEYSTFSFDIEPEFYTERKEVPVNPIKIPLLPQPWVSKYELKNLKGVTKDSIVINRHRTEKAKKAAKPWEKYDLMKIYRSTIPKEEQDEIYSELYTELHSVEVAREKQKRARVFVRPKKIG